MERVIVKSGLMKFLLVRFAIKAMDVGVGIGVGLRKEKRDSLPLF